MERVVKVEYFPDEEDGPILLIYGSERIEFRHLMELVASIHPQDKRRVSINDLPGFEAIDGVRLECVVGAEIGIVQLAPNIFEWSLSEDSWKAIAFLIEPFALNEPKSEAGVFQYLSEVGPVEVIVSTIRGW
jgi:hypothetical protein